MDNKGYTNSWSYPATKQFSTCRLALASGEMSELMEITDDGIYAPLITGRGNPADITRHKRAGIVGKQRRLSIIIAIQSPHGGKVESFENLSTGKFVRYQTCCH